MNGVTKQVRERIEVDEIKAFKDRTRLKKGLGTHDIFEYEVGADCNNGNYRMLVRRLGCACPKFCMRESLDECKKCSCDGERDVITLNDKPVRARRGATRTAAVTVTSEPVAAPEPAVPAPQQQSDQQDDNDGDDTASESAEDSDEDADEPQLPEVPRMHHDWGLVTGRRQRGRVTVSHCCCNTCHGTLRPRAFAIEADRKKVGSCGHIHVTCWANNSGMAVACQLCEEE